jgi:hypothetical protein
MAPEVLDDSSYTQLLLMYSMAPEVLDDSSHTQLLLMYSMAPDVLLETTECLSTHGAPDISSCL